MNRLRSQQGISIPAVLGILAVLTILALGFMGMVRFQVQRTGFEQATITAGYIAEMGFQQTRAQLASVGGEWSELDGIVNDCTAGNPNYLRCQRIPATANQSTFLRVYENPLTQDRVLGVYEVAIETGQKRALFGNKTLTGSTQGFVPGSNATAEQVGYDGYGNRLCQQNVGGQTCPGGFLGVRVTGWLTDSRGNVLPKSRAQSVYGVVQMNSRDLDDKGPSGYMLESNTAMQVTASSEWNPYSWEYVPLGGFYGPMHTNERFEFEWQSQAVEEKNKGSANGADFLDINNSQPYWGVLMNDTGVQGGLTPRLYDNTFMTYVPYGKLWALNWSPAGAEPAPGSTYQVTFQANDGSTPTVNVTRGAANGTDYVISPLKVPFNNGWIPQIRQGMVNYPFAPPTAYPVPAHPSAVVSFQPVTVIDWRILNKDTLVQIGLGQTPEPSTSSDTYRIRYIDHSPIFIHDKMTYANGAPIFRYWHEHPVNIGWPLFQGAHAHADVAGASLDFTSTNVNADPGYNASTWKHSHYITTDLSVNNLPPALDPTPNTFLKFMNSGFAPTSTSRHEPPLLRPESGPANYSNQMEQLNKYLQLTLGATLPRLPDGTLDAAILANAPFNTNNYNLGYLVNTFPSTMPVTSPPTVDFRAVYFGNSDLTYSAGSSSGTRVIPEGSPIDQTAWLWVDDNQNSTNFMKVSNTRLDANFKRYLYRQIPPSKVILVRDAVVLIGNLRPQSNNTMISGSTTPCQQLGAHCLDFHQGFVSDRPGEATIVDGQLSILSFTTTPPAPNQAHYYNRGDIVVVGSVLYANDFFALPTDKTQLRQLTAQPENGFIRSNVVSGPIPSIGDSYVNWITNTDGTVVRNASGAPAGQVNGLGLFASHDIKLSVTPLGNDIYDQDGTFCNGSGIPDNFMDIFMIHGQLVAGNKVRVNAFIDGQPQLDLQDLDFSWTCNDEPRFESKNDWLYIVGSVYSRESPDFSSYFRLRREYLFDESLEKNPLVGAPYYPKTAGDYRNQTIFSLFPKLVQGTWQQGIQ